VERVEFWDYEMETYVEGEVSGEPEVVQMGALTYKLVEAERPRQVAYYQEVRPMILPFSALKTLPQKPQDRSSQKEAVPS
jgi:hypothetical protein